MMVKIIHRSIKKWNLTGVMMILRIFYSAILGVSLAAIAAPATQQSKANGATAKKKVAAPVKPSKESFFLDGVEVQAQGFAVPGQLNLWQINKKILILSIPCETLKDVEEIPPKIVAYALDRMGFILYDYKKRETNFRFDLPLIEATSQYNYKVQNQEKLIELSKFISFYHDRTIGKMTFGSLKQYIINPFFHQPSWNAGKGVFEVSFDYHPIGEFKYNGADAGPFYDNLQMEQHLFQILREEAGKYPNIQIFDNFKDQNKALAEERFKNIKRRSRTQN